MKYILSILFAAFVFTAKSQSYGDSSITLTLTQRAAVYIGYYIKNNSDIWQNRLAPAQLKNYVNNGTNLDSVFSVTLKASYITGMVEYLLSGQNEVVQTDRLSIINNSPAITGYTALANQIVTIANGSGAQKNTAAFIRDFYNTRISQLGALRSQNIADVVSWSQN